MLLDKFLKSITTSFQDYSELVKVMQISLFDQIVLSASYQEPRLFNIMKYIGRILFTYGYKGNKRRFNRD